MTPVEILVTVLPFALLAWTSLGRGIVGRGRTPLSLLSILAVAWYWAGAMAAVLMLWVVYFLSHAALRKHRIPALPSYTVGGVELRDFRGEHATVAARVDGLELEHLVDFHQDLGTARHDYSVYSDGRGTYLAFSRTTLGTAHGDNVWAHSFFADGVTISSSDEVRLIDFSVPFQLQRMKILGDLPSLLTFHRAGVDAYGREPVLMGAQDYLDRMKFDAARRCASGAAAGYLARVGDAYQYTARSSARALLGTLNLPAALASSATVGGTNPGSAPTGTGTLA